MSSTTDTVTLGTAVCVGGLQRAVPFELATKVHHFFIRQVTTRLVVVTEDVIPKQPKAQSTAEPMKGQAVRVEAVYTHARQDNAKTRTAGRYLRDTIHASSSLILSQIEKGL